MSMETEYKSPTYDSGGNDNPQGGKGKAIAALVLGIVAIVLPIPFLDLICGVAGLILASMAKQEGYTEGLRTAGFVLSIIGTVFSAFHALTWLFIGSLYGMATAWL